MTRGRLGSGDDSGARGAAVAHRLAQQVRDARIGTKLGLILVIPLIATVSFAALHLVEGAGALRDAETLRSLSAVSAEASGLAHQVHRERVEALRLLAGEHDDAAAFRAGIFRTDQAVRGYQRASRQLERVPEPVAIRLSAVDEHLSSLQEVRGGVVAEPAITPAAAQLRYRVIIADLVVYQEAVASIVAQPGLAEQARAVAAWGRARMHLGEAETIARLAATAGGLPEAQRGAFLRTQTGQQEAFRLFQQAANPTQQVIADQAVAGGSTAHHARIPAQADRSQLAAAANVLAATVDAAEWAAQRLHAQLRGAVAALRSEVRGHVVWQSAAALAALVLAVVVAVLLARQLARSLRRLGSHALRVAEADLPATVEQLADPGALGAKTPAELAARVHQPAVLRSRDEIGQVARSLTVVQQAAVRIAAEQAALRTSLAAMFTSLARRSQALVDQMISELDRGERDEDDPRRLAWMFTVDNLATRMRRNDENLLILAGADSSPPRRRDAPVDDVLRAAQSEIEHYRRIEFGMVDGGVLVRAAAVNDVVRLLAELLDNATRFSSPGVAVVCEARRLGDRLIVQVEDRGLGISEGDLEAVNRELTQPPVLETTGFRRLGIAVVARLADRHGITVTLASHARYGTTATVILPASILRLPPLRLRARAAPGQADPDPGWFRSGHPEPRRPEEIPPTTGRKVP